MKFRLHKASDYSNYLDPVEIVAIEDLEAISRKYKNDLIVTFDDPLNDARITIYDDYVE